MATRSDTFVLDVRVDPVIAVIDVRTDYETIRVDADETDNTPWTCLFDYSIGDPKVDITVPFSVAWTKLDGTATDTDVPAPVNTSFTPAAPDHTKDNPVMGASPALVPKNATEYDDDPVTLSGEVLPRSAGSAEGQGNYRVQGTISMTQPDA